MTWWMWLLAINGYIGVIFATYIVLKKTGFCEGEDVEGLLAVIWPAFLTFMVVIVLPIWLFTEAFGKIDAAIEASKETAEPEEAEAELWEQKQEAEIQELREDVKKLKDNVALDYVTKLEKSYGIKPLDEHSWAAYAQHACQELDKVSVVRCKDCAYCSQTRVAYPENHSGLYCNRDGQKRVFSNEVQPDEFCSRGRRK